MGLELTTLNIVNVENLPSVNYKGLFGVITK